MDNKLPEIPLDFLSNDYEGYFTLMRDAIPSLTPEWTDLSDTDPGIVTLQVLAYGLHVLGYYNERASMENFLEYARSKKGILTGAGFLGYQIARQQPSVTDLTVTKDSDYLNQRCVIPKGCKFSTHPQMGTPIVFESMEEVVIPANQLTAKVPIIQGLTIEQDVLGMGNGNPKQTFTTEHEDVILESLVVTTIEGTLTRTWTLVDNFLNSKHSDRHFTASIDEFDRTIIQFGDGILGMKPVQGGNIVATYRKGGGEQGNLAPNLVNYVYESDLNVQFIGSVNNEERATGGKNYEDLERVRVLAPKHYRSREQAVTMLDFEDIAELTDGVAKAKCIETKVTTKAYLYLLPSDYGTASNALCKLIKDKLDANRVGNVDLEVLPCGFVNFNIGLTVYVHDGFDKELVKENVRKNIQDAFHISKFEFGEDFYASRVIDVAFNTSGVKNVVLSATTVDKTAQDTQILKLGTVTVELGGN